MCLWVRPADVAAYVLLEDPVHHFTQGSVTIISSNSFCFPPYIFLGPFGYILYLAWELCLWTGKILCGGHKVITQRLAHQSQSGTMLTPGHTHGQTNVSFSIHPSVPFSHSLIASFPLSTILFSSILTFFLFQHNIFSSPQANIFLFQPQTLSF